MCPFNKEGLIAHRLGLWAAIKIPLLRGFLARLDNWLAFGKQNDVKKWWWDLEVVDKKITVPNRVNRRSVKKPPKIHNLERLGMYQDDTIPQADRTETVPIDRKEGQRFYDLGRRENKARKAKEKAEGK